MQSFIGLTLRTERLLLRPFRDSDAPALFAMFSDERVTRYLARPPWTSVDQANTYIATCNAALAAGESVRLGLETLDGGALIGECVLFHFAEESRRAELGYSLAPDAWGHGFMQEAARAMLDFAFADLGLNRIEAEIDPRNGPSARILERLAFRREGLLRERWIVAGEVSDSGLYGLLRSDWMSDV